MTTITLEFSDSEAKALAIALESRPQFSNVSELVRANAQSVIDAGVSEYHNRITRALIEADGADKAGLDAIIATVAAKVDAEREVELLEKSAGPGFAPKTIK
jgi:hypothetical protein